MPRERLLWPKFGSAAGGKSHPTVQDQALEKDDPYELAAYEKFAAKENADAAGHNQPQGDAAQGGLNTELSGRVQHWQMDSDHFSTNANQSPDTPADYMDLDIPPVDYCEDPQAALQGEQERAGMSDESEGGQSDSNIQKFMLRDFGTKPLLGARPVKRTKITTVAQEDSEAQNAVEDANNTAAPIPAPAPEVQRIYDQAGSDCGFEEDDDEVQSTIMVATSLPMFKAKQLEDGTTEVVHEPKDPDLSVSETGLALWDFEHNISRRAHRQLVQFLRSVSDLDELAKLPLFKDSLKRKLNNSMPRRKMRKKRVELDRAVLPSRSQSHEDVLVFDFDDTIRTLVSSPAIREKLVSTRAHLTDREIREPWQSRGWGESTRMPGGKHHKHHDDTTIFPGDFVFYKCNAGSRGCGGRNCGAKHLARITWSGEDHRSAAEATATIEKALFPVRDTVTSKQLSAVYKAEAKISAFNKLFYEH